MEWSPQQEQALNKITDWINDSDQQIFRLFGYAGSGKTTLTREIADRIDGKVRYGAFTGKAAQVMRRKGCHKASTLHSMIYTCEEDEEGKVVFRLDEDSEIRKAKLVIVDEVSMVDEGLARDLLSFGVKILAIGDPAQLPPVRGAGFFTEAKPDFMLTEIHRQAQDNPIIQLSMKIRRGEPIDLGTYGATRIIKKTDITSGDILAADQVIVGLNRTRHRYNERIRELLNHPKDKPVRGDKLICLKNDRQRGLFNGTLWTVDKFQKKKSTYKLHLINADNDEERQGRKKVYVLPQFFDGTDAELPWEAKRGTQEFTYSYAITCHKSQGSQFGNVIVFNESGAFREDARRWLYTAATRASDQLTMVMP